MLQKLIVYGSLKLKVALIDQMVYFIKEFMLDSPEEHFLNQYLDHLIAMIIIWHQTEKNKVKLKDKGDSLYEIVALNPFLKEDETIDQQI